MVRLPFAVAYAGTGYDGWMLEEGEENQLAASGSVVLNTFVRVDPRWVALTAFSVALLSVVSMKAIGFVTWRRVQEAEAAAKAEKESKAAEG